MSDTLRIPNTDVSLLKKALLIVNKFASLDKEVWITFIDAIAKGNFLLFDTKFTMIQLEQLVNDSKHGIKLSLKDMISICGNLESVNDISIVIYNENSIPLPRNSDLKEFRETSWMTIDIFDSSYTEFYCREEEVLSSFKSV